MSLPLARIDNILVANFAKVASTLGLAIGLVPFLASCGQSQSTKLFNQVERSVSYARKCTSSDLSFAPEGVLDLGRKVEIDYLMGSVLAEISVKKERKGHVDAAAVYRKRAAEYLTPIMFGLVLAGLKENVSANCPMRLENLRFLHHQAFFPATVALALRDMKARSLAGFAEDFTSLRKDGHSGTDEQVMKEVLDRNLEEAMAPVYSRIFEFPDLVTLSLHHLFRNVLSPLKISEKRALHLTWGELFRVAHDFLPSFEEKGRAMFRLLFSLVYAPFPSWGTTPKNLNLMPSEFLKLHRELQNRWSYFSQLTDPELCFYETSLWRPDGEPRSTTVESEIKARAAAERRWRANPSVHLYGDFTMNEVLRVTRCELLDKPPGTQAIDREVSSTTSNHP
jgi:hypothetical protein